MRTKFLALFLVFSVYRAFAVNDAEQVRLRIQDGQTGFSDDATIYLDAGVTPAYSYNEDIQKVMNINQFIPQIYSLTTDSVACLTNANGAFSQSVVIPIGFRVSDSSVYRISATLLENFDPTTVIQLEDRQLGVFHDLRLGIYSFNVNQAAQQDDRFYLHISYPTAITTAVAGCNNNNGKIICQQDTALTWNSVQLYDANNTLINSFYNVTGHFEFTLLPEGNYNLAFTCGAYTTTMPLAVSGNQVVASIIISNDTVAVGQPIQFSASATNSTQYVWDFGDGSIISGVVNPEFYYWFPGSYTVVLTASNSYGCFDSAVVDVEVLNAVSGIDDKKEQKFRVFADNRTLQLQLSELKSATQLIIYDMAGHRLMQFDVQAANQSFFLANTPPGIYLASLHSEDGRLTQKFVVAH